MRIAGRVLLSRPSGRDEWRSTRVIRDIASLCMLVACAVLATAAVEGNRALADGVPVPSPGGTTILTHYDSFVLNNCFPCMRETYPVATLPVAATKAPDFPRSAGMPATTTRAGEVAIELLRAYPLGRTDQQHFAMRVTLSVATGLQGQTYSLGTALVDEADVPQLAGVIAEMANATAAARPGAGMSDLEFHGDTMRIGIVRLRDESVAYIQAWSSSDLPRLALKQVWEVPSLYLPVSDLAQLSHAVEQAGGKIRELRRQ